MSGFLPVVTAANNWFARRRGLATGIVSAGVNIGGTLVVVVALAISAYGWRTTALGMALVVWVLGFPLSSLMRHRPQSYGYLPDGDVAEQQDAAPQDVESTLPGSSTAVESPDFTPMQALKTPAFWFIATSHSFSLLIVGAVTIHEIPLLVDAGISYEAAAGVLAFMTAMAMVGRVSGGFIGDRVGLKPTLLVCFLLMSAGVLVLATAQTVPQALVFAVLYGVGYGARAPLLIALRGDFFGPRNFATIMGMGQPILMIGMFIGPIAAGFAYDVQGSYRMVFTVIAFVNLIGAALVFFIRRPNAPQRQEVSPPVG
jgi:MFS family permease